MQPRLIDVYSLPPVPNVCDQVLREVISLPAASMAHVVMASGNTSLLHRHRAMTEIYYILDGSGVLSYGDHAMRVEPGSYLVLPARTAHKLENTGQRPLEHHVFAVPPFDPSDVEVLDQAPGGADPLPQAWSDEAREVIALDGAVVRELLSAAERERLGCSLAVGYLPAARKALAHVHYLSDEVYYIASGEGTVMVGGDAFRVAKGSVVAVPKGAAHALENVSATDVLAVLCLSSPAYTDEDFHFV